MPKISELAYAGELGAANYILGVRDGVAVRFPVEVFQDEPIVNSSFVVLTDTPNTYTDQGGKLVKVNSGGTGLEFGDATASTFLGLSDTPDSYSTYSGKVVAVKADASGLEFVSASAGSYTIVDLTSATEDYTLSPGEVAKISYTSATSVPLHIATQEGLYEFTISGNLSTTVANDNNISVLPNNTTYSAQFTEVGYKISSGNSSAIVLDASTNQFNTAWSNAVSANLSISTKTTAKTLQGTVLNKRVNGTTEHFTISSFWNDTSTAWTSLGTITFPFAQSGIIVIKRIA